MTQLSDNFTQSRAAGFQLDRWIHLVTEDQVFDRINQLFKDDFELLAYGRL
jgi:hypothetical protein